MRRTQVMAAEGKRRKGRAARDRAIPAVLARLKPGAAAAVLEHLVEARPDLASEAEEIARSLLRQRKYQDVAAEMEDEMRALDYDVLNARAGGHEGGYVEPTEAAWEILGGVRKERLPFSADFLSMIPNWIPMVERIRRERK